MSKISQKMQVVADRHPIFITGLSMISVPVVTIFLAVSALAINPLAGLCMYAIAIVIGIECFKHWSRFFNNLHNDHMHDLQRQENLLEEYLTLSEGITTELDVMTKHLGKHNEKLNRIKTLLGENLKKQAQKNPELLESSPSPDLDPITTALNNKVSDLIKTYPDTSNLYEKSISQIRHIINETKKHHAKVLYAFDRYMEVSEIEIAKQFQEIEKNGWGPDDTPPIVPKFTLEKMDARAQLLSKESKSNRGEDAFSQFRKLGF